tara:strand:+ start:177 stop:545 length:369 start_codon:yes stop_codon:yes gene_type:complete
MIFLLQEIHATDRNLTADSQRKLDELPECEAFISDPPELRPNLCTPPDCKKQSREEAERVDNQYWTGLEREKLPKEEKFKRYLKLIKAHGFIQDSPASDQPIYSPFNCRTEVHRLPKHRLIA